jgi:hypothetical protein
MNNELERIFEESCHGLIEVLSWHLPGGTEENHGKPVMTAGVVAKILTKHLPHTSLQH